MSSRRSPVPMAGHYASHGSQLLKIGAVSLVGVIASFGFQVVTARSLGPEEFGVLSAFFAVVSMAALGSSSLQNAIAVQTARAIAIGVSSQPRRRIDGFTVEALVLGATGGLAVIIFSPMIASRLHTVLYVPLVASMAIFLSFVFVRGIGVIQGSGDSQGAVWWSTISLVLRFALVALAFACGLGLKGALASVLVGSLLAVVGALIHAGRLRLAIAHRPFQINGVVVLLMTLLFAWLTFADVILVRVEATATAAGTYAAAAVLVKSVFLVPATLSLYLLPRFVRQEGDRALTRLGVQMTIAVTAGGGLLTIAFFATIGRWATRLLLGTAYDIDTGLLVGLAVAYFPWIMAQGLLIRMNALASRPSLVVVAIASVLLTIVGVAVLPSINGLLVTIGGLGLIVFGSFVAIDRARAAEGTDPIAVEPLSAH